MTAPASIVPELARVGASELARRIAAREVSSREVVESLLERVAAVNPQINAIRVVLAEEALAGADQADRRVAAGEGLGPLHGVPVTGVQVIGARFREDLCLDAAQAIEAACGPLAPIDPR